MYLVFFYTMGEVFPGGGVEFRTLLPAYGKRHGASHSPTSCKRGIAHSRRNRPHFRFKHLRCKRSFPATAGNGPIPKALRMEKQPIAA